MICSGVHPFLCSQRAFEDTQQGEPVHVPRMQKDFPGALFYIYLNFCQEDKYAFRPISSWSVITFFTAERREAVQACGNAWKGE